MPSETAYQNYCHECDEDDIRELIQMYVDAAKRSEDAGFDYVEVIGSDSSLPTQFLQPMYNKRTDRWGGSFENRARFWVETMAALKRAVGDRVAVGTRIAIDNLLGPMGPGIGGGTQVRGAGHARGRVRSLEHQDFVLHGVGQRRRPLALLRARLSDLGLQGRQRGGEGPCGRCGPGHQPGRHWCVSSTRATRT